MLDTAAPGTPFMWIYNHVHNLTHGVLHKCPYNPGKIRFYNCTTALKDYPWLARGDYKLSAHLWDDIDPSIFKIELYYSVIIRMGEAY